MDTTLLGGLTPQQFLAEYWQKKPLLIRNAIPGFAGLVTPAEAKRLACSEDAESRLVWREAGQWQLQHGPLQKRDFPRSGPWTVLIQGLNLLRDDADALLRRFSFLPYSRLDDLMVSYATDGGGVGPHFDSYDVFLLQGMGQRRWRIGDQKDLSLVEDAPLKILRRFKPTQEWVLEPGDMLYLPPQFAHEGTAIGECTTYSIGFRAPSARELVDEFFYFVQNKLSPTGMYADPDLKYSPRPAEISSRAIGIVSNTLRQIVWSREDIVEFIGEYLSDPKQHVVFEPPERPLSLPRFRTQATSHGLRLDRRTQLLFRGKHLFMNGQTHYCEGGAAFLHQLANRRRSRPTADLSEETWQILHDWYCSGYLDLDLE